MKSVLYVHQGEYETGDGALPIISEAFSSFLTMTGSKFAEAEIRIVREEKGRPRIAGSDLDISISHSRDMWMCLVSEERCGVDFQYVEKRDLSKIWKRFYEGKELELMEASGEEERDFFDIWVRKEALGKYTGAGFFGAGDIFGDLPSGTGFKDIDKGMLEEAGIEIESEFKCAALLDKESEFEIRKL